MSPPMTTATRDGTAPQGAALPGAGPQDPAPARQGLPARRPDRARPPVLKLALSALALVLLWGVLTGWRAEGWVFGVPAVALGTASLLMLPASPGWRLSPVGLVVFVLWFAWQALRGGVDVALRAFAPRMGLSPGFRDHTLTLPEGAPRLVFVNAISLLPGTLSADLSGDRLSVHMIDTRSDLDAELAALEARVRALFALPPQPSRTSQPRRPQPPREGAA